MLEVQEYLQTNTIESLEQVGVFAKFHPTKPYVILDYDQIEASKFKEDQKVKECRGLVLRTDDFTIVHKAFNRFYNLNESSCTDTFDWSDFSTTTKEDGSLIKVRYYDQDYLITTRNSFAETEVGDSGKSWKELVMGCFTQKQKDAIGCHYSYTFVFELCTPHNTVVVNHPVPKVVLLSIFDDAGRELDARDVDVWNKNWKVCFNRPAVFPFKSLAEVQAYLVELEETKNDTEGVVLKDTKGTRLKCKSLWYLKLHRLSGNGNIGLTKNLIDVIISGESDEILSYFPYLKESIETLTIKFNDIFDSLTPIFQDVKDIEDQKRFALKLLKEHKTPFSSCFFNVKKKYGRFMTIDHLYNEYINSKNIILELIN